MIINGKNSHFSVFDHTKGSELFVNPELINAPFFWFSTFKFNLAKMPHQEILFGFLILL